MDNGIIMFGTLLCVALVALILNLFDNDKPNPK